MKTCAICGRSEEEVRILKGHVIPRFLDKSKDNRSIFTICMECDQKRAEKEYSLYESYRISENKEFYSSFLKSTLEIEALLDAKLPEQFKKSLYKLLYTNIITSLETYFSDALINIVMSDKSLVRKVIETTPEFKKRKICVSDLYLAYESIEDEVREYLVGVIYHNLAKVKSMYGAVLGVEFPADLSDIYSAIVDRHDLVHRNGKNKDGNSLNIGGSEVSELLIKVRKLVEEINLQLPPISGQKLA